MASKTVPLRIEHAILILRRKRVMLDHDLATLYGVSAKRLNEQVKRNASRFPADFMFRLTNAEGALLRSQFATLENGKGKHRKYLPYAFTEQGVAMLSSVLHSERAISVNIEIMRAFVRIRSLLATHKDLARKLEDLERKVDSQFSTVFDAIQALVTESVPSKPKIGFGRN